MEQEFLRSDTFGDAKYKFEESYYKESLNIDEFNQYLPYTRDLPDTDPLDLLEIFSLTSTADSLEEFDPDTFDEITKVLMLPEAPVSKELMLPEAPVPKELMLPEAPVPKELMLPEAPVPKELMLPEAPVPKELMLPEAPVPKELMLSEAPVPKELMLPEAPVPKELMLPEAPVSENDSSAPYLRPEQSDSNILFSTRVNNISNIPSKLNDDTRMTEVPAKADVDEKVKEIRRIKNNRASKRLRERKKYEEESVLETKRQLLEKNSEFKRQTEMLQQEKRTMLWSLKKHIEVILNSSKEEEIRKYLLHFATITDNYGEDNDLKDILGVANKIFKEVIDGHQNPGLITSVINELVKKQQKGVNTR